MRRLAQYGFLLVVALTLASIPAIAVPTAPLGVITGAAQATVSHVSAIDGTSVYEGDIISTEATGTMRLRFGTAQLVLGGNTSVLLSKSDSGVTATLLKGMVRFSTVQGSPLDIRALNSVIVRAKGDTTAIGQLSLVAPTTFEVGSTKGDLEVTVDGTDHVVAESTAYRVSLNDSNGGGGITNPAGKRSLFWVWFPIAVTAVAVAVPLILIFRSPCAP